MPFMSILTRHHPGRSNVLRRCIDSVNKQTDKDFEHIIFYDDKLEGIPSANLIFSDRKEFVTGDYVFILDDDDFLRADDFISDMRHLVENCGAPALIITRVLMENIVYPRISVWGTNFISPGTIGSSCVVVSNHLWHNNIGNFKTSDTPGDFNFINSLFLENPTIEWRDKVYVEVPHLSWGRSE